MRKLVLLVALMFAGGMLRAEEAKKEIVFDGDKVGENAKGWSDPAEKATVALQDKEVRTAGKKTVEFHAKGTGWMGCGWNWFGWYPEDSGTDVSRYKDLHFWAKLTGDKKPALLSATLIANGTDKDKKASETCSLLKYCANLADGKWHEIVIPMKDLYLKKDANRAKVWEMMLGCWTEDDVNFSLFVDEIAFEGQAEAPSRPAAPRRRSRCPRRSTRGTPPSAMSDGGT